MVQGCDVVHVCAGPAAPSCSPACTQSVTEAGIAKLEFVVGIEIVAMWVERKALVIVTVTVSVGLAGNNGAEELMFGKLVAGFKVSWGPS